jgi:hypothetical protein
MKRLKIMLLSFALLAIVGGALAFKAKYQESPICYTTAIAAATCGTTVTFSVPTNVAAHVITSSYTTPAVADGAGGFRCFSVDGINPNITTLLDCPTTTGLKAE